MSRHTDLKSLLDEAVARINTPQFIADDPVQFPRMFSDTRDIEITAFLTAIIAWGRRQMILRDASRLLDIMHHQPYHYLLSGQWQSLPDSLNIHRTLFASHLKYFLRGLRLLYARWHSADQFAAHIHAANSPLPAWHFVEALQALMCEASNDATCPQCIPVNLSSTPLKRFNMALRWLVRDDGIVDIGIWKSIPKSKLFIPLDVHVANTSRQLGLLTRRSNDRKAVVQLTDHLRTFDPADPTRYDFALFGIPLEK